jgi:hypothetical protein
VLVTFEVLFAEHLPEDCRRVAEAAVLPPQAVLTALEADPSRTALFAQHWQVKEEGLVKFIVFYHLLYRELIDHAGGNPIDNRNFVYGGFESIPRMNDLVPRYAADPEAQAYLCRYYTPTGKIEDPVLAVHTSYDAGVPSRLANYYAVTTTLKGCGKWFVHKVVDAEGHCNISPELTGKAFDQLRAWAAGGAPPEPGALR